MVKEVWVWVGAGRTLQSTDFPVTWTEVVGTEEEGWQVDKSCGNVTGETEGGGRAEDGPDRARREDTSELRSDLLIAAPRRLWGTWSVTPSKRFLQTGYQDLVPASYLIRPGMKDEPVIFANCPPCKLASGHQPASWVITGKKSSNVVPGPSTLLGPMDVLNSEAEGGS